MVVRVCGIAVGPDILVPSGATCARREADGQEEYGVPVISVNNTTEWDPAGEVGTRD
jgi:hypothetical protein